MFQGNYFVSLSCLLCVYVLIFIFCCGVVVVGLVCLRRYLSFILSQGCYCTRYNITLSYLLGCLAKWLTVLWYSLSLIAFFRSVSLSTVGTRGSESY